MKEKKYKYAFTIDDNIENDGLVLRYKAISNMSESNKTRRP